MAAADPLNIYDFEALARSRIDPAAYDYFAGGAGDELTVAENCRAFQRITFRPHVLVDVSVVDPSTHVLGRQLSFPVMLAPTALNRLGHPEGEVAAARAAGAAGTAMVLSTTASSTTSRGWRGGPTSRPERSPAGSSRCSRSDAR